MASVDVLVFTRDRHHILKKSIRLWSKMPFNFFLLDATQIKYIGEFPKNIKYLHLPGLTYGSRAAHALKLIRNEYSIICNDDECYVPSSINEMIKTLEIEKNTQSMSGKTIGIFKYGNKIVGDFIYSSPNLPSIKFVCSSDYLYSYFLNGERLPVGGIYRLLKKDKMQKLLEAFYLVREIKSPYVYQIIGEIIVALSGPSQISRQIYWIRNLDNEIINDEIWDRTNSFSSWWVNSENNPLKIHIIEWISTNFNLDKVSVNKFMNALISKLSLEDKINIAKVSRSTSNLSKNELVRTLKFIIKKMIQSKKIPKPLKEVLSTQTISENKRIEILNLAKEILV